MAKSTLLKYIILGFLACGGISFFIAYLRRKWTVSAVFFLTCCLFIAVVFADAYLIEPYWIQVRKVVIHDAALAKAVEGTKIVHITDIHLERGIGFREMQLVWKVNALKPDIIFFTGDLFNHSSQVAAALKLFKMFKAEMIVGVPGDTDLYVMNPQEFAKTVGEVMRVPLDDSARLRMRNGEFIELLGLVQPRPENLARALSTVGRSDEHPRILLSPSPDIFPAAIQAGINLVLVGDTHGGQVGFDFIVRLSRYANRGPYMRGLFENQNTKMYVNRGIGTKTRRMRFFCRPEIAVIKVVP